MVDKAAFKFDSLPGLTFVATRYTERTPLPGGGPPEGAHIPEGFIYFQSHRDGAETLSSCGTPGPTALAVD